MFLRTAQSDFSYDTMSVLIGSMGFVSRRPLPRGQFDKSLDFVPPTFWRSVYKTFYLGYHEVFSAMWCIVSRRQLSFLSQLHRLFLLSFFVQPGTAELDVRYFLRKGGKVEWALDHVTNSIKKQVSDGSWDEQWDDEEFESEEWRTLPRCANDFEFRLVRRQLGLSQNQT